LDFGSGAPVLLASQFGTAAVPNLLVQTGKEGYVYLLNAQNLGGVSPGDSGALAEQGPDGSAIATPGVWPGDGGYIYIPTSDGGTTSLGNGSQGDSNVFQVTEPLASSSLFGLNLVAKGPEAVGYGTSSPIVTSNGTAEGSAVVWIIQLQDAGGGSAELQAYNAVPSFGTNANPGTLTLINHWPVTDATKFASPGVGNNRLFVPTRSNQLLIFGLDSSPLVTGHGANFTQTIVDKVRKMTLSFVAQRSFTISSAVNECGLCSRTSQFAVAATSPNFIDGVMTVNAGQAFTVSAIFRPTGISGYRSDELRIVTSLGEVDFSLGGAAQAATPWVTPSTFGLTLPDYEIGKSDLSASTITFTNFGSKVATIKSYSSSRKPFTVSGPPKVGSSLAPNASFKARVSFSSRTPGSFHRTLVVKTNSPTGVADTVVNLNAIASKAPVLSVQPSSLALKFGSASSPVLVGPPLPIGDPKQPRGLNTHFVVGSDQWPFVLANPPANEELLAGRSLVLHILYIPSSAGSDVGSLVLQAVGLPTKKIALTGHSAGAGNTVSEPGRSGWQYAGSATVLGSTLVLTHNEQLQTGSALAQNPITSGSFTANFTASAVSGNGSKWEGRVLADTTHLSGTFPLVPLYGSDSPVGFGGTVGIAVVIGKNQGPGTTAASNRWIGVANGTDINTGGLSFVAPPMNLNVSTRDTPNDVTVSLQNSTIFVWVDGVEVIDEPVNAPSSFFVGFSASIGLVTNTHEVSGVSIVVGGSTSSKIVTIHP